jgi:hypothetical protein
MLFAFAVIVTWRQIGSEGVYTWQTESQKHFLIVVSHICMFGKRGGRCERPFYLVGRHVCHLSSFLGLTHFPIQSSDHRGESLHSGCNRLPGSQLPNQARNALQKEVPNPFQRERLPSPHAGVDKGQVSWYAVDIQLTSISCKQR